MFFKNNKSKDIDVGKISLGNVLYYTFGQDEHHSYTCIYTDKDISVMFYHLIKDMTKDKKIYLHCRIIKDSPVFYVEVEGYDFMKRAYHINMTLQRFNKIFEEEKLKM